MLKPITQYNGYDCDKDPNHTFTPMDLASQQEYDIIVNCLYQGRMRDRITKTEMERGCAMVLRGMTARRALAIIRHQRKSPKAVIV